MKNQTLIRRYTQGLVNAVDAESEFQAIRRELAELAGVLSSHKELNRFLSTPFLTLNKKTRIVKDILAQAQLQEKTRRFIMLLLERNRLDLLTRILEALPVVWNEKRGISTFEVISAASLSEDQKEKVRHILERLEKKPVYLHFTIDEKVVGGLRVKKGNVVYDTSIMGDLTRLQEKMSKG